MDVTKPYKIMGFGAMDVRFLYDLLGYWKGRAKGSFGWSGPVVAGLGRFWLLLGALIDGNPVNL